MKNLFRNRFIALSFVAAALISAQSFATTGHYTAGVEVNTSQIGVGQNAATVAGSGYTDFSPFPATDVCTTTTVWPDFTIIPPSPTPAANTVVARTHGYYYVYPAPTFGMRGVLHRMKQVCQ